MNENYQVDNNDFFFKSDDLSIYEAFSVFLSDDEDVLSELNIVKFFDDALKLKNDNKIENVFNHASMKTHIIEQTIFYLNININCSALFSDIHFDLILLQHQLMNILIMLKLECLTNADVVNKILVLQADILADN